jgi:hypothetical protein
MRSDSKFEARNTKFETSTNSQIQMSETKDLEFWNSNFEIACPVKYVPGHFLVDL